MSSFLIDSNIFIYAADESLPENARSLEVIQRAGESKDIWCIAWQNVMEFLSVVTHPRAFQGKALTLQEANSFVDNLLSAPNIRFLGEGEEHWDCFKEVVEPLPGIHGRFLFDCHLATLIKEHGIKRILTADKSFAKFHFVDVLDPFTTKELPI
jgi:toxin-antitoxin system PIN domain toxin